MVLKHALQLALKLLVQPLVSQPVPIPLLARSVKQIYSDITETDNVHALLDIIKIELLILLFLCANHAQTQFVQHALPQLLLQQQQHAVNALPTQS